MKYSDIAAQQNAAFTTTQLSHGGAGGQGASWNMLNDSGLKWPERVYTNQSLNVKLAAAKEWLKSREKK